MRSATCTTDYCLLPCVETLFREDRQDECDISQRAGGRISYVLVSGLRDGQPAALTCRRRNQSISHRLKTPVKKQPSAPPFDPLRYSSHLMQDRIGRPGEICVSPAS